MNETRRENQNFMTQKAAGKMVEIRFHQGSEDNPSSMVAYAGEEGIYQMSCEKPTYQANRDAIIKSLLDHGILADQILPEP